MDSKSQLRRGCPKGVTTESFFSILVFCIFQKRRTALTRDLIYFVAYNR